MIFIAYLLKWYTYPFVVYFLINSTRVKKQTLYIFFSDYFIIYREKTCLLWQDLSGILIDNQGFSQFYFSLVNLELQYLPSKNLEITEISAYFYISLAADFCWFWHFILHMHSYKLANISGEITCRILGFFSLTLLVFQELGISALRILILLLLFNLFKLQF